MEEQWKEKFNIYIHNLSPYYAFSIAISIFAIIFSWWYGRQCQTEIANMQHNQHIGESHEQKSGDELLEPRSEETTENLQARLKASRQQALADKLSASMTAEQLMQEKEVEKAQLAAILNLLKEQQEKFHVSDMKELEQQMSLYR